MLAVASASVVLAAAFVTTLAAAPVAEDATLASRGAAIDAYLGRLEKLGFSGVFVLEVQGKRLVERGCGLADRERNRRWTADTVSDIGSITKQFTAAAILRLREQGRLQVEDRISKYFEGVPPDKAAITLHHLLTHSSGIGDLPDRDDWDPVGRGEIVRLALAAPLQFEPGTGYDYSNAGYSLLGAILEQLTGKSYEAFLRETLFLPAGMKETGYVLAGWDTTRIASGYRNGERWGTTLERPFAADGPYWILRANGGIHSTAHDMLRWGRTLLAGRAMSAASRSALWTKHVDESNGAGDSFYGYGWSIEDLPGGRWAATHNGGNSVHFANFALVPDGEVITFLMSNVAADFPSGDLLQDVQSHLFEGTPLPKVPDVIPMPGDAAQLAGEYRLAPTQGASGGYEVRVTGNTLAIEARNSKDFARLYAPADADFELLERQSAAVARFVTASLAGDYGPMHEAYGGRVELDLLRTRGQQRLQDEEANLGKLTKHVVLGTLVSSEGNMSFVRFERERGTHYRRYFWRDDGSLRGMSASRRGPPPSFYPVAADRFESFENGVPSARVTFPRPPGGRVSAMELGPDGSGWEATRP